jgi:hypothetical protein
MMTDDERAQLDVYQRRLGKALGLLREWRDKYGGKEHLKIVHGGMVTGGSPTDLLRDTQRWIEGK